MKNKFCTVPRLCGVYLGDERVYLRVRYNKGIQAEKFHRK